MMMDHTSCYGEGSHNKKLTKTRKRRKEKTHEENCRVEVAGWEKKEEKAVEKI